MAQRIRLAAVATIDGSESASDPARAVEVRAAWDTLRRVAERLATKERPRNARNVSVEAEKAA